MTAPEIRAPETDTAVIVRGPVPAPPITIVPPAASDDDPILALLSAAVDKGVPVETMEKLVALHERMTAVKAAQAFNEALAAFQSECPPLPKSKTARIVPKSGASYEYDYCPLEVMVPIIREPARKNGLSFTWDTTVPATGLLRVVCRVRHVLGHEEQSAIEMPLATASGMSEQQKVANARTFGMRLTLTSALGLVGVDAPDNDGGDSNPAKVTEEQADTLQARAEEVGVDVKAFLRWLRADTFAAVRALDFDTALRALERVERGKAAKGATP